MPGHVWLESGPDWCEPRTVANVAHELGVTPQTVLRWARGERIPKAAQLALRGRIVGELLADGWAGWRVWDGRLWAPNGYGFHPAEIEHWSLAWQMNRALQRRVRELERRGPQAASPHGNLEDTIGQLDNGRDLAQG